MGKNAAAIAPLTFGSLFSGIGGLDLGLERAGMVCQWQVEIDEYAQKVLAKHWPNVARFRDIRECGQPVTRCDIWPVDLICGGFPCQDISNAGNKAGIEGSRSGLWKEYYRIICIFRPRYVVIENVAALTNRGLCTVLGDLAKIGYDAEWQIISAADVGALHLRKRIFIVAYPTSGRQQECQCSERLHDQFDSPGSSDVSDSYRDRCWQWENQQESGEESAPTSHVGADGTQAIMADTTSNRWQSWRTQCKGQQRDICTERRGSSLAHPDRQSLAVGEIFSRHSGAQFQTIKRSCSTGSGMWSVEPSVGRVADGVPSRVDRLRCLGNAVVSQVAELVGRLINEREILLQQAKEVA